jgi:hypothetical protein
MPGGRLDAARALRRRLRMAMTQDGPDAVRAVALEARVEGVGGKQPAAVQTAALHMVPLSPGRAVLPACYASRRPADAGAAPGAATALSGRAAASRGGGEGRAQAGPPGFAEGAGRPARP